MLFLTLFQQIHDLIASAAAAVAGGTEEVMTPRFARVVSILQGTGVAEHELLFVDFLFAVFLE